MLHINYLYTVDAIITFDHIFTVHRTDNLDSFKEFIISCFDTYGFSTSTVIDATTGELIMEICEDA